LAASSGARAHSPKGSGLAGPAPRRWYRVEAAAVTSPVHGRHAGWHRPDQLASHASTSSHSSGSHPASVSPLIVVRPSPRESLPGWTGRGASCWRQTAFVPQNAELCTLARLPGRRSDRPGPAPARGQSTRAERRPRKLGSGRE
jgi:hypothetical protein